MKKSKKFSSLLICSLIVLWVLLLSPGSPAAEPKALDAGYKVVRLVKDSQLPGGCNGAVIGPDGALYVVHVMTGEISRIDLKTNKLSQFVPGYGGTYITDDLTADDAGNFYVTGTTAFVGEVYRIDRNGLKTVIAKPADFEGLTAPNGIQYNKRTGRLFMSECFWANRVFELDPTGAQKPRLLVKENVIKVPEGFDFDRATNDLIIPDMGAGKIVRVNPDTGDVKIIAEGFAAPIALKVGKDNMAYIPEIGGNVYRLGLDGQKKRKARPVASRPGQPGYHGGRPPVHHQLLERHRL